MDEDKRILAVLDQPLPTGYSRWSNKLIAKATNVDLRYVQDFMKTQTEQKAIELVTEKLVSNGYVVIDANIAQPNNPVFDLDCMRNGQRQCVVDSKGFVGGGTGWDVTDRRTQEQQQVLKKLGLQAADLYYILVGWVNGTMSRGRRCGKDRFVGWWDREAEPKFFIASQNDVNKVCQVWEHDRPGKKVGPRPVVSPEEAEKFGFENQWHKLP